MDGMVSKLAKYGANVIEALERMGNDEKFYGECVKLFLDDRDFAALGIALAEKKYDIAFDQAHTLKGVAGNLSLTPLLAIICEIVESLRVKNYIQIEEKYQNLLNARDELKKILAS